ncbi:ABC transporter ATP-binding protein [Gulosibacter sp. 10]|uniref:ABC transporter ATP-binding protein n=1 Tax=Gulosibacter sp. 10 TaxID=1255570 RepID=UPI00097E8E3A|nr:ABC transporter ATP-binding protein [Gulosibacter sp. 10]SJM55880.1 Hydroxymethylpyrimidine ABC transporter, ATPase component [Gulosibacter sp. 10]
MTHDVVPRLRLSDLVRTFPGRRGEPLRVLDGISLSVAPGEFVSVIGPSGAGKSTLFNLIAGLDRPTSGRIEVDGRDATGSPAHAAYMPQRDLLFPWRTVLANAALGLEVQGVRRAEARARVRELFPRFGLAGFEDAHPFELSGGMRQRAALLRTVAQGRPTLLLDEPFGALDSLTRMELQAWLQEVWAEHSWTALLVTHDIREALLLSDRVVVLSPRPARVTLALEVALPRPRGIEATTGPEFAALERTLLEHLTRAGRPVG